MLRGCTFHNLNSKFALPTPLSPFRCVLFSFCLVPSRWKLNRNLNRFGVAPFIFIFHSFLLHSFAVSLSRCKFLFCMYLQCYFHRCHLHRHHGSCACLPNHEFISHFFFDWLLNAPTWMLHTYYGSIPLHLLASRVFVCLFFPPTPLYNLLFLYSMQYLFARRSPATERTELLTQRFFPSVFFCTYLPRIQHVCPFMFWNCI